MIVLLDLNVAIDALLGREPWRANADAIWDANVDARIDAWMSAAPMPTLFYIIRKNLIRRWLNRQMRYGNPTKEKTDLPRRHRVHIEKPLNKLAGY